MPDLAHRQPPAPAGGPRYALFLAPPAGSALWAFGSAVIGYDAVTGDLVAPPDGLPWTPDEHRAFIEEPSRYGFHGTLKPPFHLADGQNQAGLLAAAAAFARECRGFTIPRLDVAALGSFLALVPAEPAPDIDALAAEAVRALDPFRAPLSPADRERRLLSRPTERQLRSLDRWGYPYVLEDFRFHMTLTGPLPERWREPVREALSARYATIEPGLSVDAVAVFRQADRAAPFKILARLPFGR